jgi:hypothetical protein
MLERARNTVTDTGSYLWSLTSPNVPNHTISASAGTAILLVTAYDTLSGCCDSYSMYAKLGIGLTLELLAVNEYGWGKALHGVANGLSSMKEGLSSRFFKPAVTARVNGPSDTSKEEINSSPGLKKSQ